MRPGLDGRRADHRIILWQYSSNKSALAAAAMKAMKTRLKANNFCCLWKCIDFEGLWHLGLANLASFYIVCTDVDNHRNDLIYLATTKANFRKPFSLIGKWTFNHPISEGQMENAHHHHYSPRLSVDSNPFNYIHPRLATTVVEMTQKISFNTILWS